MKPQPKHVLILGCGRSGTSIFGELFEHLPDYTYYSEPDFAQYCQLDFSSAIAAKVPRDSAEFPAPAGLSFPPNELPADFRENGIIFWQIRHPLDAICSLRVGISKNWGHHPRPHDWQTWLDRPLIERCAHHWTYLNSNGYQQLADQTTICRFEEMIDNPQTFAENACLQAGVDITLRTTEIGEWADRVQDTNNEKFIEAETSRPYSTNDHSRRVGRWKENLSKKEVKAVLPIIAGTAVMFGYELPGLP